MVQVWTNAAQVAAQIGQYVDELKDRMEGAARTGALLVETRIKANASLPASGPPGPRAITGDYRASWNTRLTTKTATEIAYTVGTDRPQAKRLEHGFVGVDALGRHYNQPPYPHVGPAVDEMGPAVRDLFKEALRR